MADYSTYDKSELLKVITRLEKELKTKKYGLVWDSEKEPEQVVLDCENNLPILKRIKTKEIKTDDNEDNILIEGDNYHALTVLNYTHKEKIDVIYIDPPYNTGQKDFIYNDRYIDSEHSYKHSKWLSFMEKRLNLAKNLLTKDGVIFASIDDNEYPRLIMLFEKLFGEKNVKTIAVKMSETSGLKMGAVLKNGTIPKLKEYIVIAKLGGIKNIYLDKIPKEAWDSEYNIFLENFTKEDKEIIDTISQKENITLDDIKRADEIVENINITSVNGKLKELKITAKDKEKWLFDNSYRIARTTASTSVHKLAIEKKEFNNNELFFVKSVKGLLYFVKSTFSEDSKKPRVQMIFAEDNLTQHPGDFWSDIKTTGLDNEGNVDFKNGKKPIKLIERLIKSIKKDKMTVLDFFAGSGTTGEVVLKLQEDRDINFILCTTNDDKESICTNATYPRLKYSIEKYGGNLQYFRTDFVKKTKNRDQVKINLTKKCTEMLCVKENIFNIKKEEKDYKIFTSNKNDKFLCIYYNFIEDTLYDFIEDIKALNGKKIVYVFSIDNDINKTLFSGIRNLTVESIPQNILNIYKQLVKMNIPLKTNVIFTDYNKAKTKIFIDKDKDDGARVLRVVLEKLIQKISQDNSINILNTKGKEEKATVLNDKLYNQNIITQIDWEENKTFLTIGNDASHGDYDDYELKQVEKFYRHIQTLLNSYDV